MQGRLGRAYGVTTYAVLAPDLARPFLLHPGHRNAGFEAWLTARAAGTATIITAWNPASRRCDAAQNQAANAALAAWLTRHGFGFLPAENRAADPAWTEAGFCVPGLPLHLARHLARRWGQNAILHYRSGRPARLCFTRRRAPAPPAAKCVDGR